MQRVKWHDGLSVGVDEIDGQHRALFKAVNAFLDSVESASNMDDVAVVITFLEEYLEVHFETEERAMIEHGYPHLDEHLAEHKNFADTVTYLKEKYLEWGWGTTSTLKVMLQRKLVNWLTEHVSMSDKRLGTFLQGKGALEA